MKPKIIHISTHYYPINGGQQIYIDNLKKYLVDYDHIVIQIKEDGLTYPDYVYPIDIPRILKIKAFAFYVFNYKLKKSIDYLISNNIIDINKDIFLCHYAFHYAVVKQYKNVFILSHGVEWDGPGDIIKKLYHHHRKNINLQLIKNSSIRIIANDLNYYLNLGLKNSNKTHFFSQVSSNKWLVPNCVDTEIFKRHEIKNSYFDAKAIVIPRNIVPQRGMEFVIKAFGRLKNDGLLNEYKLYIVGAKYDLIYFESLVNLVNNLKISNDVIFYGSIPYHETPIMYNSAELVIIFSLFREGTSLAALEAMACGTIVISTDIGGLKDLPTVKANKDDLDSVILKSLANSKYLSFNQMEFVKNNFSSKNWIDCWNHILKSTY